MPIDMIPQGTKRIMASMPRRSRPFLEQPDRAVRRPALIRRWATTQATSTRLTLSKTKSTRVANLVEGGKILPVAQTAVTVKRRVMPNKERVRKSNTLLLLIAANQTLNILLLLKIQERNVRTEVRAKKGEVKLRHKNQMKRLKFL
jgi:hypothetical protein